MDPMAPNADPGLLARARRVATEFSSNSPSESNYFVSTPLPIPAGTCLNWRSGVRCFVPIGRTAERWRSIFEHAGTHGGVAHRCLHPHNLVTGVRQAELLEAVLAEASRRVESGSLRAITQLEYRREILDPVSAG